MRFVVQDPDNRPVPVVFINIFLIGLPDGEKVLSAGERLAGPQRNLRSLEQGTGFMGVEDSGAGISLLEQA